MDEGGAISESHIDVHDQTAFDRLQAKLVPLWSSIERFNKDEQTVVVVPNAEVDFPLTGAERQAVEERYLFLLLLLRQPRARMVYVTGQVIDPAIIDYYLGLLPGVIPSHARKRLHLVAPRDPSPGPLTEKLLARPSVIEEIRSHITNPDRAHLIPFLTSWKDRELAMRLGIPMYGADPIHLALGTKSRSRELFAKAGADHPLGREDLRTEDDLTRAIIAMRKQRTELNHLVVKLDEGVSGAGNANLVLGDLPPPGDPTEADAVTERLPSMQFELGDLGYAEFLQKLQATGGIVEERIVADEIRSPSVQLRVTPRGDVELLSTHDQVLGGPSGQTFLGSRFPADQGYVCEISRHACAIGNLLASKGVLGRFAIDFVTARKADGDWDSYAIEVNLRKGGTTHPFLTLQFLTDGTYDPDTGDFTAPNGRRKYYVASDHVESPAYRQFTADDLFDIAMMNDLHFDQTRQTGVVFHMLRALQEKGRVGITAVGDSHEEADQLHAAVIRALDEAAGGARLIE